MIATFVTLFLATPLAGEPWPKHIIDDGSRGADGVRLADVNGDDLQDIATGWEQGGITRVYVHPGYKDVRSKWPAVTVGPSPNVEDAVFCDIDGDGAIDVVSSSEGKTRTVHIHWAPGDPAEYTKTEAWQTQAIPATVGVTKWMFAEPLDIDGRNGVDIAVSSKGEGGAVGWLQAPVSPRDVASWAFHKIYAAGWIMSLAGSDVDADGDQDLIVSDRKGSKTGVLWLENPGKMADSPWRERRIGSSGREVMFLDVADLDQDGHEDIIVAVKPDEVHWHRRSQDPETPWTEHHIKVSAEQGLGRAKGVAVGDLNLDGKLDIVYSCEGAVPPKHGVIWLSYSDSPTETRWTVNEISGSEGIKYDRIELLDTDGDGDLDVLTC